MTASAVPVDESIVKVGDVSLFTRTAGRGPVSVVLHGGPGAHHDYLLPQFDALATGRTLRYYDQRGGGRSPVDRDVDVGWRAQVEDLLNLLDYWRLDAAPLVGYSWGGLLAMLFAIEHPDRVAQLALVSPAPCTAAGRRRFEQAFSERSAAPEIATERAALRQSRLKERDPDAYRQRLFELSVAPYFHDIENVRNLTPFRVTGRTQQEVWRSLGAYDLRSELKELSIPATVLHGRYDPIPMDTAEETARLLHAPLTVMEHSGHVPYVEDFDAFRRTLNAFLPRDGVT